MRYKGRDIVQHRQYQNNLHGWHLCQTVEQREQQLTGRCVQPDKRIVHNQYARSRQQSFGQLEFTQFTTGKKDDLLIEHRLNTKEFKQFLFQLFVFDFSQRFANIGCFVLIVGIPALLIVIISIGCSVSITKSDIFYIIIDSLSGRRRKVILQHSFTQRIFPNQSIDKKTFSPSVRSYDCNVFTNRNGCRDWSS